MKQPPKQGQYSQQPPQGTRPPQGPRPPQQAPQQPQRTRPPQQAPQQGTRPPQQPPMQGTRPPQQAPQAPQRTRPPQQAPQQGQPPRPRPPQQQQVSGGAAPKVALPHRLWVVTDEYNKDGECDGCLIGVYTTEALADAAVEETEAYWAEAYEGEEAEYHSIGSYEFEGDYNVTAQPDFDEPSDSVGEDDEEEEEEEEEDE